MVMALAVMAMVWPGVARADDGDQRVADLVAKNLKASESLKGFQIRVQYREGTALLQGTVRSQQQLDEAVAIANRAPQVERVISQLEVRADSPAAASPASPASGGSQVVPASALKTQRLPPALELTDPSGDKPILRSALKTNRSSALGTSEPSRLAERPVTQRLPAVATPASAPSAIPVLPSVSEESALPRQQGSALRSIASLTPRTGTSASASPSRPVESAPVRQSIPQPQPLPMQPLATERPRPIPQPQPAPSTAKDSGWGRSGMSSHQPQTASTRTPTNQTPSYQGARRPQPAPMPIGYAGYAPRGYPGAQVAYPQPAPMGAPMGAAPMTPPMPAYVPGTGGGQSPAMYDQPYMPNYAWPSYAPYPNYAALTYPKQYSPAAWPYIGPFYPYPQVPLGWRKVTLEWDDGWWYLDFSDDRRHGGGR